jgi:hypothetical protein
MESVDSMEIPVSRLGDDRAVGVHRVAVAVNSRIDPAAVKEQLPVASCRVPPSRLHPRYVSHLAQGRLLDPSIDANEDSDSPLALRCLAA